MPRRLGKWQKAVLEVLARVPSSVDIGVSATELAARVHHADIFPSADLEATDPSAYGERYFLALQAVSYAEYREILRVVTRLQAHSLVTVEQPCGQPLYGFNGKSHWINVKLRNE